jgi:G:T-mismatch repair DNA endonuclease (very short patch repair protein)
MKPKRICTTCGSLKYYCKGLCKSCYTKQLVPAKWSHKFDVCIRCNSSKFPHVAKGLCDRCYHAQDTSVLCACGCGLSVFKSGNKIKKYRKGHWIKNNKDFMDTFRKDMTGKNNPQYGKFGKNHPAYGHKTKPEVRESRRQRRLNAISNKGKKTDIEIILSSLLDKLKIVHISQKILYNKFSVDEFLPKFNLIIEAYGGYWHGDNRKFETLNKLQTKNKRMDAIRAKYLNKCGHRVLILWETELKNNPNWCKKEILFAIKNFSIPLLQDSIK